MKVTIRKVYLIGGVLYFGAFLFSLARAAEESPKAAAEIAQSDLRRHVEYLASEELEGRMTGSGGSRMAAEYLAGRLRDAGLEPGGDAGTYFQTFEFFAGARVLPDKNAMSISVNGRPAAVLDVERDFRPLSFTEDGEIEGEVVFAGYGLAVPGKEGERYESYAGLDVRGKIVLVLRYAPEEVRPARRAELNRYAGLRYKAMLARERGAKGLLVVTGPNSPGAGELVAIAGDNSAGSSGIAAFSITGDIAARLFAAAGKDLKTVQSQLDREDPHPDTGFAFPGVKIRMKSAVERVRKSDRNVIGILPPSKRDATAEYVLMGAHYDHLGYGEAGAMRRKGEEHAVHHGADDNASGCAAVLELAVSLAQRRKNDPDAFFRGIIFAFWSGEEIGLVGSSHFAEHPTVPLKDIAAYMNFDMVGRLRENKLNLQGVGSSSRWRKLIERRNLPAGFALSLQDDPYLPTDTTAFYPKQVPVLNFFTGAHDDYHRPTDTASTLNYEGLQRVARLARALALDLVQAENRPEYVKVERSDRGGGRDALRIYIGSIPDYVAEVAGVKISGVRGGSPAEKGGLRAGDIIAEFGGQKVANIYDYTYALDAAKVGAPVQIKVLRAGKPVTLSITPEARK